MPINQSASQYFISCVSKELGSYRRMLKHHLSALRGGVEVKIQEDFIQGNDTLLEELNAFVRDCEGVIHLVGERCGELPTDQHVQVLEQLLQRAVENRYSMTQWEYHLARHHDKRTLVYLTTTNARIDEPVEQHAEAAAIQQAHRVGIHESGKFYGQFNNHQQLRRLVFRDLGLDEGRYIANLPFASLGSLFKGRDEVLTKLKDGLGLQDHRHYQGVMAITANTTAASVHGLGGIGKTRAAVEFAVQYREDYCALLFCIADTPSALINNIAAFCGPKLLDLPAQHEKETELQYQAALHWLKQHPGWLLIIDNVDSEDAATAVQKLAGELSGSGQILITSRISDWPGSMLTAALDLLDPASAIAFLLERTDRAKGRRKADDDEQQAALLAETLGYLPLALEQAGAYICRHRLRFDQYLEQWQQQRDKVLKWYDKRTMQYPASIAITWQTSFKQLTREGQNLLNRLAWFSHEPIPESLLDVAIPGVDEDLREALADLEAYSFVTRDAEVAYFSVHRLVQEVTKRAQRDDSHHSYLQQALSWLGDSFISDPQDVRNWPQLEPLAQHVKVAVEYADQSEFWQEPVARLMNDSAVLFQVKTQHHDAEPLMRRALAIDESSFGPDHPEVATDLNNLAQLLQATNRLSEAEPLMRRALAIDENSFGPEYPRVATALNNLALLLQATNRLSEAEPLMRRALAIVEHSFGPDHPEVATTLNNLAQLLQAINLLSEAEPLMRRALVIDESSFGPDHPNVAIRLNNLASLLLATNRLSEAEPLMRRALDIDEHSFGSVHTMVAIHLNNLAQLLQATNRFSEAELLMRRALTIDEHNFGPDHPTVAIRLNNLARLLQDTHHLSEAEPLMRRTIEIFVHFTRSTGHEHPNLQVAINNYAILCQALGDSEAEITDKINQITDSNDDHE